MQEQNPSSPLTRHHRRLSIWILSLCALSSAAAASDALVIAPDDAPLVIGAEPLRINEARETVVLQVAPFAPLAPLAPLPAAAASSPESPNSSDPPVGDCAGGPFGLTYDGGGTTIGGCRHDLTGAAPGNQLIEVDPTTGFSTVVAGGLTQGLRNFSSARDDAGGRYFYATPGRILNTVDVATGALIASVPFVENIIALQHDDLAGTLLALVTGDSCSITISGDSYQLGEVGVDSNDLVEIDPLTGLTVTLVSGLPGGLRNFASALDDADGAFYYRTGDELVTVDLVALGSTATPTFDNHMTLDVDQATGELYALVTGNGGATIFGSAVVFNGTGNQLVTVDPLTGLATAVGGVGPASGISNFVSDLECLESRLLHTDMDCAVTVLDTGTGLIIGVAPEVAGQTLLSIE